MITTNEPLSRRQVLIVFSGLLLAMLLAALDSTIVATALPTIVSELGGLQYLAWVVTAYLLAQTIVAPLYGKLGDLYGRKIVLQSGIVIFLIGSALCGMSGSMFQLILFRFVQGLGGGGLIVTAQAVVADIVSPRERGRYQGIFGAVFGLSSIAGPLLGGYFTTAWSWRWIFYINIPLGLVALLVIAVTLPRRTVRVRRAIDYAGAALLAAALSAIVLFTDLGGVTYSWTSAPIIALGVFAIAAIVAFIQVEQRSEEPVLPLRLFANRTFTLTAGIALIVGLAMFGSVTYLPLFLQVVNGASPTASGLQMTPMMGGMLFSSITSGQLISRWGRYKFFPIAGTLVMAIGLFLLSRMTADTPVATAMGYMLVLGLGLGLVMQVLVIAVQNSVEYTELGVATSGATLFRLIGGSLGTAIFGALFAAGLQSRLAEALPGARGAEGEAISQEMISSLPPAAREIYLDAFTGSLSNVFLIAAVLTLIAFALAWFVPEQRLRETVAAIARDLGREAEDIFPLPSQADSILRLERALSLVASRAVRRRYIEAVVGRAGLDLSPMAAWLLVRVEEDPEISLTGLARDHGIEREQLERAAADLVSRGYAEKAAADRAWTLTPAGCRAFDSLIAARRAQLEEVLSEWPPERRGELASRVAAMSGDLVPARAQRSG